MSRKKSTTASPAVAAPATRLHKVAENVAGLGILLILGGLMVPLFNLTDPHALTPFKWLYAAGALLFTAARAVGSMKRNEPMRLRRLRRLEFWGGVCFIIGAAFWFYQEGHLGATAGPLAVIHDTILFTLSGAAVQIIASWLIYAQLKKSENQQETK